MSIKPIWKWLNDKKFFLVYLYKNTAMFQSGKNPVVDEIVQMVESATKAEQKRMLYLLKVEKTRSIARKLSKRKPARKFTDEQITQVVHEARMKYGRK